VNRSFRKALRFESTGALKVSMSKGTEMCSCVTFHRPSILQKQTVFRPLLLGIG
jgi:hypothetical protein